MLKSYLFTPVLTMLTDRVMELQVMHRINNKSCIKNIKKQSKYILHTQRDNVLVIIHACIYLVYEQE